MRAAAIVGLGFGGLVFALLAALALPVAPALAAEAPPDCVAVEASVAQLICRDQALNAATSAMDAALSALGETTDAAGRDALSAGQAAWLSRREQTCPVAAADLTDPKLTKERTACLLRAILGRTEWAAAQRKARLAPVAELPLTVSDAAAGRPLPPIPARPVALTRPVTATALSGRWAKADPVNRTPLDDCRTSYLEVSRELSVALVDPRIPGLPVEGRLSVVDGASLYQGVPLSADSGAKGTLRLEAAETPRLDRLFLRMEQPMTLGATYVRCR